MKKQILIIFIISLMLSCNSQSKVDLAQIVVPCPSEKLLSDDLITEKRGTNFEDMQAYRSTDSKLLNFNDVSLSGKLNSSGSKFLNENHVEFYVNSGKNQIPFIRAYILTTLQSKELYNSLIKTLGEPTYYKKNEESFNGAWEKNNITYLFNHTYNSSVNNSDSEVSDLYIIDSSNKQLTDHYYSSEFQYFGDFVKERKKKNNPNFTYLEFAKYKADEDWDNSYLDRLKNNKPL